MLSVQNMASKSDYIFKKVLSKESAEEGLRYFFLFFFNALPYAKRGLDSNYGEEPEQTLKQYIQQFFATVAENQNYLLTVQRR